ncbi:predicted protein, partial [Thalassiosira pseudonana CCMP1335]
VPEEHMTDGLADTDTVIYISVSPICPGTYLASATYCSSDQYDRPVAGILSICIDNVHSFFYDEDQIKRNIVTIMHEMAHILGFNALTTSAIPLPSTNITKLREVRGGVRAATIVTPTVRRVVRNMFGCQTLPGAELERAMSPGECIGDHWERRLFRTDLLNPIVDDVPYSLYISSLTLAYFSDSGWYKVNTDRIAPSSIWGRNAGCNFVNQKCISPDGRITAGNNPFFCNNFIHGCDLDSSRKAVCSLVEYDSAVPDEYNYFGKVEAIGGDHFGGSDPTLDYCPVFEGFSNGQCNDKHAKKLVGVRSNLEVFGGDNSRCVIGNVNRKRTALCLPIACVIQDQSLMVKVDGYWKQCLYAGQIISVWWNRNDYVVCPDPSHLC